MEEEKVVSPLKAIRAKCLDCCCDQRDEVKMCPATKCPLWGFRLGKNPNRKSRVMSDEQKAAAKERLAKARASRKNS